MSDGLARLAALNGQHGARFSDAAASGRLSNLTGFGSNPGALNAGFYLPANLPEGAPLVVVLHGCTQNAAGYDHRGGWSQLADEAGFALLYPEQQHANNPNLCFNWFRPEDTRRDSGEALSIRQMIEAMVTTHGLDRRRIFVTGLSAGGAMASVMLATYPEVFAGGGIIAGLAYGCANTVPEAFDCMRGHDAASQEELWQVLREASTHAGPWPRVAIWQGTADHTVAPSNADDIAAQWRSVHHLGAAPTRSEVTGERATRIWCDAAGEPVIELNTIAAMGHGTPVGGDLGVPGPYMLDVGISSTREIARFWGIADAPAAVSRPARKVAAGEGALVPAGAPRVSGADRTPREDAHAAGGRPGQPAADAFGVRKTIEDALRTAGLMR